MYYDVSAMSAAIGERYSLAKAALAAAGFSFVDSCHTTNPSVSVPDLATAPPTRTFSAWFASLTEYLHTTLGEPSIDPWGVMLNGVRQPASIPRPLGCRLATTCFSLPSPCRLLRCR